MEKIFSSPKKVSIIGGTGKEGKGLAIRLAQAGYEIYLGSRSIEKAEQAKKDILSILKKPALIHSVTYIEAAYASDIIILSVPYKVHKDILLNLKVPLSGKLLIDVTVPLDPSHGGVVWIPPTGSACQEAHSILGDGVDICSAFQNISYTNLSISTLQGGDVLVTGTSESAREKTLELVKDAGFIGWDAGLIQNSIVVEGLTSLLIYINKKNNSSHAGIKIIGV